MFGIGRGRETPPPEECGNIAFNTLNTPIEIFYSSCYTLLRMLRMFRKHVSIDIFSYVTKVTCLSSAKL